VPLNVFQETAEVENFPIRSACDQRSRRLQALDRALELLLAARRPWFWSDRAA